MTLRSAYNSGVKAAFARYKVALSVSSPGYGADYGVMPTGAELSHGTDRFTYPLRARQNADVAESMPQDQFNADWLWKNQDLDHMAPGNVSGFGQETIG